ncbi:MAG: hypothetical protein M1814_002695 [Vezdaea aestivalis]|nr:MAG: hypothetical protein M1814_002695 [Vezdaea aestivalis]
MVYDTGQKRKSYSKLQRSFSQGIQLRDEGGAKTPAAKRPKAKMTAREPSLPLSDDENDPGREATEAMLQLAQAISSRPNRTSEKKVESFKSRVESSTKQLRELLDEKDEEVTASAIAFRKTFLELLRGVATTQQGGPELFQSSQLPIFDKEQQKQNLPFLEDAEQLLGDYKAMSENLRSLHAETGWTEDAWTSMADEVDKVLEIGKMVTTNRIKKLILWDYKIKSLPGELENIGGNLLAMGREQLAPLEDDGLLLADVGQKLVGLVNRYAKDLPIEEKDLREEE